MDSSSDRRDGRDGYGKGAGPAGSRVGGHEGQQTRDLDRKLFGYLGLEVSTDALMEQLRGPVDHL